jgi:hypothetical protein
MATDILIDSGAFSAKTQNEVLDIDKYIEYIEENEDVFDKYFNLDVIGDGDKSFANYLYMRAAGLRPIPVWHAETDPKFLTEYLALSDYVAIGAISVMSNERTIASLDSIWRDYLTDDDGFPICKVHGFGLTSILIMHRYPWYSVDSTSWVQFGRYGVVLIPQTRSGNWVYNENPHIVCVSGRSPRRGDHGKHIQTFPEVKQKKFIDYIEHMGFKLGLSQVDTSGEKPVETVIEEGVANNHLMRDKLNMLYYVNVEKSMPKWPWQFKPKTRTRELV